MPPHPELPQSISRRRVAFIIGGLLLMLLLIGQSALGAASRAIIPPPPSRSTDFDRQLTNLLAEVGTTGRMRVIVGLAVATRPEGVLSGPAAIDAQRRAIARAQDAVRARLAALPATVSHTYTIIPALAATVDAAGLQALAAAPEVVSIGRDRPVPPLMDQSNKIIGAPAAWASGYTGSGQTVAVLDTGVDKNHPFLAGQVIAEACFSTTEATYSSSSLCPGGVASSTAPDAGEDCGSIDGCSHGTHVAGTIAGKATSVNYGGESVTISGVAPEAKLIAIQVFSRFDSDSYCGIGSSPCILSWSSDQIAALEHVYSLRNSYAIASINMSLGGGQFFTNCDNDPDNQATRVIIDQLRSVNIATVIASGNEAFTASIGAPACISSAVSVGATTTQRSGPADRVASFSNSASFLSLLAPGGGILSSVVGGYAVYDGTSMATPHVAGAWAVLKQAVPGGSVSTILTALQQTGASITDSRNGITKPRIQIDAALATLASQATATPTATSTPTVTPTIPTTQTPLPTPTIEPGAAPTVYINYLDGAPGSSFLVEGYNFTPGATLELRINDLRMSSAITVDQDGRFRLLLATLPEAMQGYYEIIVTEQGSPYPEPTLAPYPAPFGGGGYVGVASDNSGQNGYSLVSGGIVRVAPPNAPAPLAVPDTISTMRYIFLPAVER